MNRLNGLRNQQRAPKPLQGRYGALRLAAIALVCAIVLSGGWWAGSEAAPRPVLVSAAEIAYPPYSLVDEEGRVTGFSVELLRAALSAVGRDVQFRSGPWTEVRGWLTRGEVQALPLVGRTPQRESLFDFTFPYMSLHGAIVVRKGTTGIQRLSDLKGLRVAVMKGDNAEEFLRREDRGIDIRTTLTFKTALSELSAGRHDAVFIQRLVALRLIREAGITNLRVISVPVEGFRQDFSFAVKEGDRDTLALLNEGLSLVMADGTFRRLHARWFAALELPTHRALVIGGDHDYPPFEYLDENGRAAGLNVEITRAIAQEMGLELKIRLGPWSKIRQSLMNGEIDAIQGMLYSPEREHTLDFTPAYTVNHYVGVVRKGEAPPPRTIEELKDRRLVVQKGDIMHDVLMANGLRARVSAVDSQQAALVELAQGRHDCALVARLTALYWMKRRGWDHLVLSKRPLLSPAYGYAVPNGNKALLAQLSEGLKVLDETGEFQRIREKWLGVYEDVPPSFRDLARRIAVVLIPLFLLLLTVLLWSWSLRRQVAARTRELKLSTELQRSMVACSPVALYSIDFQGRVLSWNASAERIFGWTAEEVVGRFLPAVPEDGKEEFARLREGVRKGDPFVGREVLRTRKDGTPFYGNLSAGPIHDTDGQLIGIMAAMEDITQRVQAERDLHRAEVLLKETQHISRTGGWEWDSRREEMSWTDETYRIHEMDPDEDPPVGKDLIARSLTCYAAGDRPSIEEAFLRCVETGEPYDLDCRFITPSGRSLWVRTSGRAVREGGRVVKVRGNFQDITRQKTAERALHEYSQRLEEMVEERTRALKQAQEQLVRKEKLAVLGQLAGGVGHELRNPLGAIKGAAYFLNMVMAEPESEIQETLDVLNREVAHSEKIIQSLFDYADPKTPKLHEGVNLNDIIHDVRARMDVPSSIEIVEELDPCLPEISCDPDQIHLVIRNLLSNAVQALPKSGRVTVWSGTSSGGEVEVRVSDTGEGIPEENREAIFEPLFTTKAKGIGLGLALCRTHVEAHGGSLKVEEPSGGTGSTFTILLPLKAAAA